MDLAEDTSKLVISLTQDDTVSWATVDRVRSVRLIHLPATDLEVLYREQCWRVDNA
jgi:hypothetical protein